MRCRELVLKDLKVSIIPALSDNYVYLFKRKDRKGYIVVDPSEAAPVLEYLKKENEKLTCILNTHHHHDHVGGDLELKGQFHCSVICSTYDQHRIAGADKTFMQGGQNVDDIHIQPIEVPGHTLGHTALYLHDYRVLFSGDTLFSLGCGRLFEGTHEQLFDSLQKLKNLPPETLVLCGHEYTNRNSQFMVQHCPPGDRQESILRRANEVAEALHHNELPTPTKLEHNLFLRANTVEEFRELRIARDNFKS